MGHVVGATIKMQDVMLLFMTLQYNLYCFEIQIIIQYSGLKHMDKPFVSKSSSSVITNTIEDVCLQKKRDRNKVFEIVSRVYLL